MPGSSVETLIQRRHPARNQFHLRAADRLVLGVGNVHNRIERAVLSIANFDQGFTLGRNQTSCTQDVGMLRGAKQRLAVIAPLGTVWNRRHPGAFEHGARGPLAGRFPGLRRSELAWR